MYLFILLKCKCWILSISSVSICFPTPQSITKKNPPKHSHDINVSLFKWTRLLVSDTSVHLLMNLKWNNNFPAASVSLFTIWTVGGRKDQGTNTTSWKSRKMQNVVFIHERVVRPVIPRHLHVLKMSYGRNRITTREKHLHNVCTQTPLDYCSDVDAGLGFLQSFGQMWWNPLVFSVQRCTEPVSSSSAATKASDSQWKEEKHRSVNTSTNYTLCF